MKEKKYFYKMKQFKIIRMDLIKIYRIPETKIQENLHLFLNKKQKEVILKAQKHKIIIPIIIKIKENLYFKIQIKDKELLVIKMKLKMDFKFSIKIIIILI
jgi:hypothetical protein